MTDLEKTLFVDRDNRFKSVQLVPEQVRQIRENQRNLTKEGAEFYLRIWRDNSRNHVMVVLYDTMLHGRPVDIGDGRIEVVTCSNFAKSGFVAVDNYKNEGRRIYSRDKEGKPSMVESVEKFKERVRFQEAKESASKELESK